MKKILLSTLVVLALVAGCGRIVKTQNGQEAVVTIKNGNISVDDLYTEMKNDYALSILINMIDKQILGEIYKDSDDQKDFISSQKETFEASYEMYYKSSYDSYNEFLRAQGFKTESEFEDYLALSYKRNKAVEDYAKSLVKDKEIKKYYQDEIFGDITASHILVTPSYKEGATEEEVKESEKKALNTAKSIIKELNNGAKFDDLIKKYNETNDGKVSGAKLAPFNKGGQTDEFEKACLKLSNGKYTTTPIKDENGYHIILKVSQDKKPKLEDVKEDIIKSLSQEKINNDEKISQKALIALRDKYKVEIQDKELNKQYKNYILNYE